METVAQTRDLAAVVLDLQRQKLIVSGKISSFQSGVNGQKKSGFVNQVVVICRRNCDHISPSKQAEQVHAQSETHGRRFIAAFGTFSIQERKTYNQDNRSLKILSKVCTKILQ